MGASIYIADDEKNIRDLITKFLESDGYSVTAFETGDELMEEFLKKPCELVILDIMMPGTDGLTICRQLRTITDVPIIMLTAKDSDMLKEPKKAFSREEILEGVWGFDTEVETRVTDETLRRIRRKLSLAGSNVSIGTIWGFGYRISIAEDKK